MAKILVTGGAGFIGSQLVDHLITDGHQVVVIDNLSTGSSKNLNSKAIFYELDVRAKLIPHIFEEEQPDYVFHLAAQISVSKSFNEVVQDADSNILGTINILESCVKFPVKKIIFSSSAAVYGNLEKLPISEDEVLNPSSPYGVSKLSAENYIKLYNQAYGLNYSILRFSNVFGPRQNFEGEAGVVAIFISKLLSNKQVEIYGTGDQTRDLIYVGDIINACRRCMEAEGSGTYNISSGTAISVNKLYQILANELQIDLIPIYDTSHYSGIKDSVLDYQKAKSELGYYPIYSLDLGLQESISYFRQLLNK